MPEAILTEYTTNRGATVIIDREASVLRGVKVLGQDSRNRRVYPPAVMAKALPLYEGAKVNIDHAAGKLDGARAYGDRFGVIRNVRANVDSLYADLHYNPKHPLAEQLLWDAEHAPENVGLSHVVQAKHRQERGQTLVEEITRVVSVDLVADPATTKSLFEGEGYMEPDALAAPPVASGSGDMTWDMFVEKAKGIFSGDGDPAAKAKALGVLAKALLKLKDEADAAAEVKPAEKPADDSADKAAAESLTATVAVLKEQLDAYQAREKLAAKKDQVEGRLAEAKLPAELVTDLFREQLMAADDAGQARLIAERLTIAKSVGSSAGKPKSKEQMLAEGTGGAPPPDAKSFASKIKVA